MRDQFTTGKAELSETTMTPFHSRWAEFCERLGGPEGCNFHEDETGKSRWLCQGQRGKSFAVPILKSMGMDAAASLAYFKEHGGACDCEILFNVEEVEDENAS